MSGDIHGICPVEAVSKFYDVSFHPLLIQTNWYMIEPIETQILFFKKEI